jgi:hypothetical protein
MNTGGPAFPAMHFDLAENEHGMTLRDYFAAKAMQALMVDDHRYRGIIGVNNYEHHVSSDSYKIADAMLKAREA